MSDYQNPVSSLPQNSLKDETTQSKSEQVQQQKELEKTIKEGKLRTWTEEKVQIAKDWIDNEEQYKKRRFVQEGIYFCQLGENIGSEQVKKGQ